MTSITPPVRIVRPLDEESVYDARRIGALSDEGKSFTLIDVFAGAGGLTLGFTEEFGHTFRPVCPPRSGPRRCGLSCDGNRDGTRGGLALSQATIRLWLDSGGWTRTCGVANHRT